MIFLTLILITIIAGCEISRLYLTHRRVSKKRYFDKKLEGTEHMVWDFEFKIFKTKEIREDVRKEYDNAKSRLYLTQEKIKALPGDRSQWSDEDKRLDDQDVLLKRDVQRFEEQMKRLDLEIDGSKPTNEYPDGMEGINHQIDSLRELQLMLKDWIRRL